jgi:hypothetical protein
MKARIDFEKFQNDLRQTSDDLGRDNKQLELKNRYVIYFFQLDYTKEKAEEYIHSKKTVCF